MASWLAWLPRVVVACSPADGRRGAASCPPEPAKDVPPYPTLRRKRDFDALARGGTTRSSPLLVLRALRTDGATTRIGLSTPRSLGGAVQRNRVRRRLRALMRERYDELGSGWDLLVIARPAAAQATYADLREALTTIAAMTAKGSQSRRRAPLPVPDRLRMGAALAFLRLLPDGRQLEGQTAAAW